MKTGADLLAEARERITEVSVEQLRERQERGERVTLIDVRDPHEVNVCKIPGAVCVSRGNLESKVEGLIERDQKVVIICARGNRSALAALTMTQMGYADVASMARGMAGWSDIGGEIDG